MRWRLFDTKSRETRKMECARIRTELEAGRDKSAALNDQLMAIGKELAAEREATKALRAQINGRTEHNIGPGIFLCSLPKSGSIYVLNALTRGLNKPALLQGAGGFFPRQSIPMGSLEALRRDRFAYMIHAETSIYNLTELSSRLDRMVVHVRDPRQAIVSWANFIPNVIRGPDPVQAKHYRLPDDFLDWTFADQLDWHLDNFYPFFVDWIAGWLAQSSDPSFGTKILFRTQEMLRRDPIQYFTGLLDFYDIPMDRFTPPPAPKPWCSECPPWRKHRMAAGDEFPSIGKSSGAPP